MQAPQGSGCPVEKHGPVLFAITVLAVLSGKLNLMARNVNATPAASQKLQQVVSVSFSCCCNVDGEVWIQPHVQTRDMNGEINMAMAKMIGRTGVKPER